MGKIKVHLERDDRWGRSANWLVTGCAFYKGEGYKGANLAEKFSEWTTDGQLRDNLEELNGFFAGIRSGEESVGIISDPIRSIPVYYGFNHGDVFVSDNAHWICSQIGPGHRDRLSEAEFLLTGYVTGPDTLLPNLHQIQAGEHVEISRNGTAATRSSTRYYRFNPLETWGDDWGVLKQRLDDVLLGTFDRLVEYADGRPVFVPLSGGYDSRLAVIMLKRLDYENLHTFSFGRSGNAESEVSQEVSDTLEVPWHFVEYTNEKWNKWYHSDQREAFYEMAYDFASLPGLVHMVWPAVWELKDRGIIPDDAVFVPGHSADFLAGSHLPNFLLDHPHAQRGDVIESIWKNHYNLWRCGEQRLEAELRDRIGSRLHFDDHPIGSFEEFDWQERQAKFILADLRTYEFWGYDWWVPFWDREFMDFWRHIPTAFREDKELYDSYVRDSYAQLAGVEKQAAAKDQSDSLIRAVHNRIKSTGVYNLTRPINKRVRYAKAPTAWPGVMPKKTYLKLNTGSEGRHSFFVLDVLDKISFESGSLTAPPRNGEITSDMLVRSHGEDQEAKKSSFTE